MKKPILLIVSACILVGSLVGCGKTSTPSTSSTSSTSSSSKQVTITTWVDSKDTDFNKQQRESFMRKFPSIKINTVVKESTDGTLYLQALAAGTAPDMFPVSLPQFQKFVSAKAVLPLDEYFSKYEEAGKFVPALLDKAKSGGKLYGVPSYFYPIMFGYNKKLFADAGIAQVPNTWEEMVAAAKKITDSSKGTYGYNMMLKEWTEWWFQYYVWQAGGDLTKQNSDGTISLTFTDPAVVKALNYYKELINAKAIQSDITLNFEGLLKTFASGKVGMMPTAGDWVSTFVSQGMKAEDIGLAEFPAGPGQSKAASISGQIWTINPNSKKEVQDAVWEYIKYMSSAEQITANLKDQESKGAVNPQILPRTDLKLSQIVKMDPEYDKTLAAVATTGRDEFAGKAVLGKYINNVIQKIAIDKNADPLKELQKAQDLAQKEVLEQYNADIKAGK